MLPRQGALAAHRPPAEPVRALTGELRGRVDQVVARITGATFTGKGDKDKVPKLYYDYATRITDALQDTLALVESQEVAEVLVPPMPTGDAGSMRAWHLEWLRAQHAHIADALSGQRLDALDDCVRVAVEGHDVDGKPLAVRDAGSLCEWLHALPVAASSRCALLTAGPATGKTWLMSQLIMHTLGRNDDDDERDTPLLPVLVRVEQLQKRLDERRTTFDAADDWVDAELRLTCEPPHYEMLRAAMRERRVLLLLDGLDEAGAARARVERHVADVARAQGPGHPLHLAPRGARRGALRRLPQADARAAHRDAAAGLPREAARGGARGGADALPARQGAARRRDGRARHRQPAHALHGVLHREAAQGHRHAGHDRQALRRGRERDARAVARARVRGARALLQATLFEAHAAQQRVVTEAHLASATKRVAKRVGKPAARAQATSCATSWRATSCRSCDSSSPSRCRCRPSTSPSRSSTRCERSRTLAPPCPASGGERGGQTSC